MHLALAALMAGGWTVLLALTGFAIWHQHAWFKHISSAGATSHLPVLARVLLAAQEADLALLRRFTGRGSAWPPLND